MKVSPEAICKAWKEFAYTTLKPEVVRAYLETPSEWSNSKPKTIRHMTAEELANLRQETIDALVVQGSTRQRAEELTAHITASAYTVATGQRETAADNLGVAESAMPYIDKNGDLVIPVNSPQNSAGGMAVNASPDTRAKLDASVTVQVK